MIWSVLAIAVGGLLVGSQLVAVHPWQAGFLLGLVLLLAGGVGVHAQRDRR